MFIDGSWHGTGFVVLWMDDDCVSCKCRECNQRLF